MCISTNLHKTILSPEQAFLKICSWCAYQERSQNEAFAKLKSYQLDEDTINQIITKLIEENFLNEERFAMALVSGKFKIKQWGKIKIKQELRFHKISDYLIKKALNQINEQDYFNTFTNVTEKKVRLTKEKNPKLLYYKVMQYLISRGFESDYVNNNLKKILNK